MPPVPSTRPARRRRMAERRIWPPNLCDRVVDEIDDYVRLNIPENQIVAHNAILEFFWQMWQIQKQRRRGRLQRNVGWIRIVDAKPEHHRFRAMETLPDVHG